MRAYVIQHPYGIGSINMVERSTPPLLPNQVLIKMKAVALNYRDRLVINGIGNWKAPVDRVLASDGMGVIEETANDVKTVKKGDRIAVVFFPNWLLQGIEVGSKEMLTGMIAFFDQYKLSPVIDSVYGFEQATSAFQRLEQGRHFGKICISIQ